MENVSLFWALKGGGPNFGIVTQYDIYTVPIYDVWLKIIAFTPDQATEVLTAYDIWQKDGSSDVKSNAFITIGLDSITLGLLYTEPAYETPLAFAPFSDLEPTQVVTGPTNTTIASLIQMIGSSFPSTRARWVPSCAD